MFCLPGSGSDRGKIAASEPDRLEGEPPLQHACGQVDAADGDPLNHRLDPARRGLHPVFCQTAASPSTPAGGTTATVANSDRRRVRLTRRWPCPRRGRPRDAWTVTARVAVARPRGQGEARRRSNRASRAGAVSLGFSRYLNPFHQTFALPLSQHGWCPSRRPRRHIWKEARPDDRLPGEASQCCDALSSFPSGPDWPPGP